MARVGVLGATGYAGALAARLIERHPHFELACVTARTDAGLALSDVHRRTRIDMVLEQFHPDEHGDVEAAIVA